MTHKVIDEESQGYLLGVLKAQIGPKCKHITSVNHDGNELTIEYEEQEVNHFNLPLFLRVIDDIKRNNFVAIYSDQWNVVIADIADFSSCDCYPLPTSLEEALELPFLDDILGTQLDKEKIRALYEKALIKLRGVTPSTQLKIDFEDTGFPF